MHDMSIAGSEKARATLKPKTVTLDPSATDHVPLLNGPPETVTMRSGSVVLHPGQSVGKHSTGEREEAIVVLAGTGELRASNERTLSLDRHTLAYCPPATEHDVVITGTEPLRYIYIVASARPIG